jgi:hypothetical protein
MEENKEAARPGMTLGELKRLAIELSKKFGNEAPVYVTFGGIREYRVKGGILKMRNLVDEGSVNTLVLAITKGDSRPSE